MDEANEARASGSRRSTPRARTNYVTEGPPDGSPSRCVRSRRTDDCGRNADGHADGAGDPGFQLFQGGAVFFRRRTDVH